MMGSNISFKGVLWKIIPKLSLSPLLSGAMITVTVLKIEQFCICVKDSHEMANGVDPEFHSLLSLVRYKLYIRLIIQKPIK